MKKIFSIIILLFLVKENFAQNLGTKQLDSLYHAFIHIKSYGNQSPVIRSILPTVQSVMPDTGYIKCGFGIINEVKTHLESFPPKERTILTKLLSRPQTDTSFVSPSGFFRIHFTKTDFPDYIPNNIGDTLSAAMLQKYKDIYLDSLAIALDSTYNFEINYLGYSPPPSDNGAGGDNKYDVYIENLGGSGSGLYGYTEFETETPPGSDRWTSYMVIDDDYKGYYTQRINGARVTVAHEFFHSIEGGDYIYRASDTFFYEMASTSMETFVFNTIHDYFAYLSNYFNESSRSFADNNGYDLAIWNIFLKMNFGYNIIKEQWELMPKMRALKAIKNSLIERGSTFGTQLNKFGIWTYYTNYRADTVKYFPQAKHYPLLEPITSIQFQPPLKLLHLNSGAVSNSFILFTNPISIDTIMTIVTNADIKDGIDSVSATYQFNYALLNYQEPGSKQLAAGYDYYEKFSADRPSYWLTAQILNNILLQSGQYILAQVDYAFPSPFNYNKNKYIFIPVQPDQSQTADLNIYTINMDLVYKSNLQIQYLYGQKVVKWNAMDKNNNRLPTGVYLFFTKSGNNITSGKLVILNE